MRQRRHHHIDVNAVKRLEDRLVLLPQVRKHLRQHLPRRAPPRHRGDVHVRMPVQEAQQFASCIPRDIENPDARHARSISRARITSARKAGHDRACIAQRQLRRRPRRLPLPSSAPSHAAAPLTPHHDARSAAAGSPRTPASRPHLPDTPAHARFPRAASRRPPHAPPSRPTGSTAARSPQCAPAATCACR